MKAGVVLLGAVCAAAPLAGQATGVGRVGWLQGCWVGVSPGRVVEENWTAPRGGSMIGVSRTLRGDSLLTYELVIVRARDTTLQYEAHPARQAPATFTAIHASDTALVFENRAHDFPQRVGYRRIRNDSLVGYIEGSMGGRARRMEFPYARARCEGASAASPGPRAIVMMRHVERAVYDNGDGPLSPTGHARARSLAHVLEDAGVTAIYISARLRTQQTAAPLAEALRLTPVPVPGVDSAYASAMLARFRTHGPNDVVLVIGHFNTFVPLLRAMGYGGDLAMKDFEHDDLYVVFPRESGPPTVLRMNYGDASAGAPVLDSTLIAVDQRWDSARVRGDTALLARLLADEFVHTDETGEVTGKQERLARMAARGPASASSRSDDTRIQRHGSIAVVTHRLTERGRAWRSTHVFVWRDDRWQAVAHHSSLIP